MPGDLPTKPREVVTYVGRRAAAWAEGGGAIGITPAQAEAVTLALADAEAALARALALRQEAKAATEAFYQRARRLRQAAAVVVRTARTRSRDDDTIEPTLAAELRPVRTPRRSAGRPATPTRVRANFLDGHGRVEIRWHAAQPEGVRRVMYQVARSVTMHERAGAAGVVHHDEGGTPHRASSTGTARTSRTTRATRASRTSPLTVLGFTGSKRFVDPGLPVGAASVRYVITPIRGGRNGEPGPAAEVVLVIAG